MVPESEYGIGASQYPPVPQMHAIKKADGKSHASIPFLGMTHAARSTGCISMSFMNGTAFSTEWMIFFTFLSHVIPHLTEMKLLTIPTLELCRNLTKLAFTLLATITADSFL